jgi:putative FmdB family regulatory protein
VPLHEYACAHCGRFEVLQKFHDQPLGVCPTCGETVHLLISAPAIQFKGSGWYVTDYARKPAAESKAESKAEPSASTDSGKDSSISSPKSNTSTDSSATGSSPT